VGYSTKTQQAATRTCRQHTTTTTTTTTTSSSSSSTVAKPLPLPQQ
jgi:hypothetical protein